MNVIIFGGRNTDPPMVTTPHHALTSSNFCPSPLTLENHLTWTTHLHPFFAYFLILRWICCSSYSTRHQIAMGNTWWGNKFFIFRLFENHITLVIAHSWNPFFYYEFTHLMWNTTPSSSMIIILLRNFSIVRSSIIVRNFKMELFKKISLFTALLLATTSAFVPRTTQFSNTCSASTFGRGLFMSAVAESSSETATGAKTIDNIR